MMEVLGYQIAPGYAKAHTYDILNHVEGVQKC
jgi:hypothetical protein